MTLPPETITTLLDGVAFLAVLSEPELNALAGRAETVRWDPGTTVFEEGDRGDACYVIHSGRAKIVRRLPDGQPITIAQVGPGGVVGELALFGGDRRAATLEALEPTVAVAIGSDDLIELLRANPDAAIAMTTHVADMLRAANDRVFGTATATVNGRVLATLLAQVEARQARRPGEAEVELVGGAADVARLAGVSKDEAARVLHWLENEEVIRLRRGRILVRSTDALRGQLA